MKHLAAAMDSSAQHRLVLQNAGLAGPVRRSTSVTALLAVPQLKVHNEEQQRGDPAVGEADAEEQLRGDPAVGQADAAGEPADV
eukprot:4032579-Amphidinium_carterae.2